VLLVFIKNVEKKEGSADEDIACACIQVTVFGESAGAISLGIHLLRSSFSQLAHAAVCYFFPPCPRSDMTLCYRVRTFPDLTIRHRGRLR
jgi:hypothetical protein